MASVTEYQAAVDEALAVLRLDFGAEWRGLVTARVGGVTICVSADLGDDVHVRSVIMPGHASPEKVGRVALQLAGQIIYSVQSAHADAVRNLG